MTKFNLSLPEDIKDEFKEKTHERGTTMQAVLSAFAHTYIESPDKFKLKMEISECLQPIQ